ncbi:MAG TPA: anaerobic glycerol-3-phosphate dehydrogenase subunit A [Desulfovibrio sp.]|nr:anaerobic glycerol-3-phosphate dehydrogenase subunit A [Desulfovibrio sp.]
MQTQVLIIGAGATGTGVARDLALRGVDCILIDQRDVNAGASGGNHGLLHSGGRYVFTDPHAAAECKAEGDILKRIAPQCIEETGGYFVAVEGDDPAYASDFPGYCAKAGVPCREVDAHEARRNEPAIAESTFAVYEVEDASVDPFKLSLENVADAGRHGGRYLRYTRVLGFDMERGRIVAARVEDMRSGREYRIVADEYVVAAGAWSGGITAMAGCHVDIVYAKGTLLVTQTRMAHRVINRLRTPGDGDILVPGGTVSVLGTTSLRVESPDDVRPTVAEVDVNINEGMGMVPSLADARFIRAYAGVRPLVRSGRPSGSDRAASRGFVLLDHEEDGVHNLVTIAGGKLTTYRLMAERAADLVCERLGVSAPCLTAVRPISPSDEAEWAEPGVLQKQNWWRNHDRDDYLLCECEIVPKSGVDSIIATFKDEAEPPRLLAIGLRSRVGKGSCQGAFCGARITAHMHDRRIIEGREGLDGLREFLGARWKGQRPILWGAQFNQAELKEALYFGLVGMELE